MYCPECGRQNSEEARFCHYCGTKLLIMDEPEEDRMPEEAYGYDVEFEPVEQDEDFSQPVTAYPPPM